MTIVHLVAGARPNFMKIAPLYRALVRTDWARPLIIHTGQHFSPNMSDFFFNDLGLPPPDHNLGAAGGNHARQIGMTMIAYEELLLAARPDWVIVVGDVDSTIAAALTAKKLQLPVAHLEAGLRSFDRTMPEEINRIATDAICDLLWTPSPDADENLLREGAAPEWIERVGNVMIDCLEMMRPRIVAAAVAERFGLASHAYGMVTLHRPSNVDRPAALREIIGALTAVSNQLPLVFPIHPRTRRRLHEFGLLSSLDQGQVRLVEPLGYIDFMSLVVNSSFVITDSGGIQEETTYLGVPCLTLRETTERPVTITQGTNQLIRPHDLATRIAAVLSSPSMRRDPPEFWDGHAADRVVTSLARRRARG